MKPYYKNELTTIYNGDCLEVLREMKDNSIDLIHIDPPYNINIAEWDKWPSIKEYVNFMTDIFKELDRILKYKGTMYFWHMDMKQIPHLLIMIEKETSFILNNQIIWDKGDWRALSWLNPTQNNNLRSWFTTTEYCYMFTKQDVDGGRRYKENIIYYIRQYIRSAIIKKDGEINLKKINKLLGTSLNGGGTASSILSLDKSKPTFITKKHYVILQREYEDLQREYEDLQREYEDLRYTFNLEPKMNNIWKSNYKNNGKNHICEKPLDLIEKIVRVSSNKNDVVLDCFNGSGTTGVIANQLKRKYIGVELLKSNCDITIKRLSNLQTRLDI